MDAQIKFFLAVDRASKGKTLAQINAAWDATYLEVLGYPRVLGRKDGPETETPEMLKAFKKNIKL